MDQGEKAAGGDTSMPDLSDDGFEMLQVAVRLARDKQVRSVAALRERLKTLFGGDRAGDIDQALVYWGARLKAVGVCD